MGGCIPCEFRRESVLNSGTDFNTLAVLTGCLEDPEFSRALTLNCKEDTTRPALEVDKDWSAERGSS